MATTDEAPVKRNISGKPSIMKAEVMTVAEIAIRLNVTRRYVRRLITSRRLRATWGMSGEPIIERAEAERYVNAAKAQQRIVIEAYMRASQELEAAMEVAKDFDDFLTDAMTPELSESTRLRAAFDAVYELCKALVDVEALRISIGIDSPVAFARAVVEQAAASMELSADDSGDILALCAWAVDVEPLPPWPLRPDDAVALAGRVLAAYRVAHAREVELDLSSDDGCQNTTESPCASLGHDVEREARRNRRRLVHKGTLLRASDFCQRRGISRRELTRLEQRREIFGVEIAHRAYYPAALADVPRTQRLRLARMCRHFTRDVPGWVRWDTLLFQRGSLGDITAFRALRRGASYRLALVLAESVSEEWRPRW
ncbi:hypothetical protein V4C53_23265 [Paraburkholderia azotifigens]|uniref:hypothetical protein n=1 Tax=Paraburkholderia azotifigens TaxID=2057004 RepID=UPI0031791021